jgi:hypothetical protein
MSDLLAGKEVAKGEILAELTNLCEMLESTEQQLE